jgi:hypothetical protein
MSRMNDIGFLRKSDERYEFHYPELGLVVRGNFVEWVLEAAAEIITYTEKLRSDGKIDELETLLEFGEADEIEVEAARFEVDERFEVLPQCVVSMGTMDYQWMSKDGGDSEDEQRKLRRIHNMSLTRNDTFLANVDGVDTSSN